MTDADLQIFDGARSMLLGIAYRMLGSRAEAEDVVQDSFVRWQQTDRSLVKTPAAWLTTVCTRRCIDVLGAAHRARVTYVGSWLPEPVFTDSAASPEDRAELADSLSTAFLLLLERLSPKERAAYLLVEIFGRDYREVAATLSASSAACRQLVSRARVHVSHSIVRDRPAPERQRMLLSAFQNALESGDTQPLSQLLAQDVTLRADSGGKAIAIRQPISGRDVVQEFVGEVLAQAWRSFELQAVDLNSRAGLTVHETGKIVASLSFSTDSTGLINDIFIMRNPDKLAGLSRQQDVLH